MRTLVDIPEEDIARIRKITKKQGISRAEYIRRAIKDSLKADHPSDISKYFGLWTKNRSAEELNEDGLAFQRRLRSEWDRD